MADGGAAREAFDEGLIIDLFAGGGGAGIGVEEAYGRHVDVAINHDPEAVALSKANRPHTLHLCEDVLTVRPKDVVKGRRVAFLWASPDCTFHSKARGGKPHRDPEVAEGRRGLAWVVVRWARDVGPEIISLENVEEFADWGPLGLDGRPDKARRGLTFRRWVGQLRALGYVVEWRELRACDYGAPTSRKRLFVIARRDGFPIVWPSATHAPPEDAEALGLLPYRTAAECIDWSLPCPSIFGRKKPLAEKTMARIARGIRRFVLDAAKPFIVPTAHAGDCRVHSIDDPLRTVTGAHRGDHAVVAPFVVPATHGDSGGRPDMRSHDAREPMRTITTRGAPFHVVAPFLTQYNAQSVGQRVDDPCATVVTKDRFGVIAPVLVENMTNNVGQAPDAPLSTVLTGNHHYLAAPVLVHSGNGERPGQAPRVYDIEKPLSTVVAEGQKHALVTAFVAKHYGGPRPTSGSSLDDPAPTITCSGQVGVVASSLVKLMGSCPDGQEIGRPVPTIRAQGTHLAEARAFLTLYYGDNEQGMPRAGQTLELPFNTVPCARRFGLVTIDGAEYEIADIGFRMLQPRELYRAQGFDDSFKIDIELDDETLARIEARRVKRAKKAGTRSKPRTRRTLSKEAQIRMCGNSVNRQLSRAIAAANRRHVVEDVAAE